MLKRHRRIEGRKRFQKVIFLLQRKYGVDLGYRFVPYYFGPYSKNLQLDINLLKLMGLLEVHPTIAYIHKLTRKGSRKANEVESRIDSRDLPRLINAIAEMRNVPTSTLINEAKALMSS